MSNYITRRVLAVILLLAVVFTLAITASKINAWQQTSPSATISIRKVIKKNGWEIPGQNSFVAVSSTRSEEIDGVNTTIIVHTTKTETFVECDGYFLGEGNILVINTGQCLVRDLLAYQRGGKVFAWGVKLVPVTDEERRQGSASYPGAMYNGFFIDYDGDGKFETRLGALSLKEVPPWVKELKE